MTEQSPVLDGGDVAKVLALADRVRESPEDEDAAALLAHRSRAWSCRNSLFGRASSRFDGKVSGRVLNFAGRQDVDGSDGPTTTHPLLVSHANRSIGDPSPLNMTADPYTGNRYAFGGGNPLPNIELDGHEFVDASGAPTPGSQGFFHWMQ
jgi:hypothetical protein